MLNEFARISKEQGWQELEFEASKHSEENFGKALFTKLRTALLQLSPRDRWNYRAKTVAGVLSSFRFSEDPAGAIAVSFGCWPDKSIEGIADHGDLSLDLTDVLTHIGGVAREKNSSLVIIIDEVQFLKAPQLAELAGDVKSDAERLFHFPHIGSLDKQDSPTAIIGPAEIENANVDDDAVELMIEITQGYPYFIPELGYQAWEAAAGRSITIADVRSAKETHESKLDESFFRVRLDRATPMQSTYMRAMAELGPTPQKAADVAAILNRKSSELGPTRAQLISMSLLYTPEHGFAAFTVPDFDTFMKRAVPSLEVPPRKGKKKN